MASAAAGFVDLVGLLVEVIDAGSLLELGGFGFSLSLSLRDQPFTSVVIAGGLGVEVIRELWGKNCRNR